MVDYLRTNVRRAVGPDLFGRMAAECDVDFILCVPRLAWLQFLQTYPKERPFLLQSFLPPPEFDC